MIVDLISDLHGFYPQLEGGDLLIVAGDLTAKDEIKQYFQFFKWIGNQNYNKKIVIAGNHDNLAQKEDILSIAKADFEYLQDSGTEFTIEEDDLELEMCGIHPTKERTFKIWGSPWTKTFEGMNPRCKAFTVDTEDELMDKWDMIPDKVDILITHSPPYGILDEVATDVFIEAHQCDRLMHVGSKTLYGWLKYFERPKLHVFGHVHEGYGRGEFFTGYDSIPVISVNASHVNEYYRPVNKPIRIIL